MTIEESLKHLLPAEAFVPVADRVQEARPGLSPDCVVRPASTEEVAAVMAWASDEGVGVLPIGSGRRADPVLRPDRYFALSTERLTGIETYEPNDLTLTAAAGTLLSTVDGALREQGQWTPFDPPYVGERSLGGLVAKGESGPLWVGYGELRNHVLGLTVVTGDGRVLELGGRVVKNVAGFDVVKSMVGSRGSLAVVTSVCVRAFPRPVVDRLLVLRGESVAHLLDHATSVGTAPVIPGSAVVVDEMDGYGGGAALIVRLHGATPTVDADQAALEAHLGVPFEIVRAPNELLPSIRDHGARGPVVLMVSALPSQLAEVLSLLDRLEPSALVIDPNAARFRVGVSSLDEDAVRSARDSIERLGGALFLERFPGVESWEALGCGVSADEVELTLRLQEVFDPAGVLWPARRLDR